MVGFKKHIEVVKAEKNIRCSTDNDFIVRGVYTFHEDNYLDFVMEYMIGGNIETLLLNVK
jgi:hypothetical protein